MQADLESILCKFGGDPAICLREEAICAKVYKRTDRQTDRQTDRRRTPRHRISSFLEWANINRPTICILKLNTDLKYLYLKYQQHCVAAMLLRRRRKFLTTGQKRTQNWVPPCPSCSIQQAKYGENILAECPWPVGSYCILEWGWALFDVLMSEFVRSRLNTGVFAELVVDGHTSTLLTNCRNVRQTYTPYTINRCLTLYLTLCGLTGEPIILCPVGPTRGRLVHKKSTLVCISFCSLHWRHWH